ncbi:MAG: hypothetical protein REI94_04265 [Moraxellaceae bacterium]|nr:hypothetical protein [Moraxellaceae bacterium]
MFRKFRIAILLIVLATVALGSWRAQQRATSWEHTLHVAVYPINGDGSAASETYIRSLQPDSFADITDFIAEEAKRHGVEVLRPIDVALGPATTVKPPPAPTLASALSAIMWSLKLRWWAWRNTPATSLKPDVRLYVQYYDPQSHAGSLHSHGLQKGQIGVINAFASRAMRGSNAMVIAHEFLHTLGATDKYGPDLQPRWPDGFADPQAQPRYPQRMAELMAGRIPRSESESDIPRSLNQVLIGPESAAEIGWLKRP